MFGKKIRPKSYGGDQNNQNWEKNLNELQIIPEIPTDLQEPHSTQNKINSLQIL